MKVNIASNEVIHFIGIGGIGMSGLAQIMKNMRFTIISEAIISILDSVMSDDVVVMYINK